MILLRLTGEGEIFFTQERIGKDLSPFKLYKFATMLKNSPNIGTGTVTTRNDPRILPIGRFLRKTKVNELPQLFNVISGDMSIVGPRPLTTQTFGAYPREVQIDIGKVRPGLSGIGSIVFRREEEILTDVDGALAFYEDVIAPYKGELERWYTENSSVSLYLLVILVTVWIIIFPNSKLAFRVFKDLPRPEARLREVFFKNGYQ
jgi:lipopolysaccharide/colanic/teichoic acid biosynthesis glycosyltransferase